MAAYLRNDLPSGMIPHGFVRGTGWRNLGMVTMNHERLFIGSNMRGKDKMKMKRREYTICVTQKDIDAPDKFCPVDHAMKALFGKASGIGLKTATVNGVSYIVPVEVQQWMRRYDNRLPVRPFTFKLREFVDGYLAAISASAI